MKRTVQIFLFIVLISHSLKADSSDSSWVYLMFNDDQNLIEYIPDFDDAYGVSFKDINNDNLPDLYVTRFRELNRLLINRGQNKSFIDKTIQTGLGGNLKPLRLQNLELGSSVIDFNNDGLQDVLTIGWGITTKLQKQQNVLDFNDISEDVGIEYPLSGNTGIWSDIDVDGDLDLFMTDEHGENHLYIQSDIEKFTELTSEFGLDGKQISQGAAFGDLNNDGYPDLYVCNWFEPDILYLNNGGKYFNQSLQMVTHLTDSLNSNGVTFGDLDNDGDLDIVVTDRNGKTKIYRNDVEPETAILKLTDVFENTKIDNSFPSYSASIADFNNDGLLDIFFTNIGSNLLYLNQDSLRFELAYVEEVEPHEYPDANYSTGSAFADLENDGDLDLFVSNKDVPCKLFINPVNTSNYLRFELEGINSNRDAIGSKIWLFIQQNSTELNQIVGYREISSSAGYLSCSELIAHFGVKPDKLYSVKVQFPSGKIIIRNNLTPNQLVKIAEVTGFQKQLIRSQQKILSIISQKSFLINSGLFLLLLFLIAAFMAMAIKRYLWKARPTAIFLFTILSILFIFWMATRERPLTQTMIIQIAVVAAILLFTIAFMEKLRQVNAKRFEYRSVLHRFSEDLIFIRTNSKLYKQLVTMIQSALNTQFTGIVEINNSTLTKQFFSANDVITIKESKLTRQQIRTLLVNNYIADSEVNDNFPELPAEIDLLIPIKKQKKLFAILILINSGETKYFPQEDVTLLTTVANQASLAIENNLYIEETKNLTKSLTESRVQKRYVKELEDKNRNLEELYTELKETQSQLIQSEKMSSLGQLVAGVAHELNNPIGYLYANMKELQKYIDLLKLESPNTSKNSLDYLKEDIDQLILESVEGSERVKTIVENLKKFSRLDEAKFKYADIHAGLDSTIMLIEKELDNRIVLHKKYSKIPPISCMPGHLNQVFLNILLNATQSIKGKGNIWISTKIKDKNVIIKIKDDGKGIPKANINKIFEPFFTTKPIGMGTGLGLSISYGIIHEHGGSIKVKSKKNKGTTFTISIPYKPKK